MLRLQKYWVKLLKQVDMDTFTKDFIIEEKKVSNLQEEEKKLLELSPQLYQTLVTSLSNGIPAEMKAIL